MAYDETLAQRIRERLAGAPGISEQRMFGGLAFLVDGRMAVAVSGQGSLLVRADPAEAEDLVARSAAEPMVMNGRPMKAWLLVAAADVAEDGALERWVGIATRYARSLPPK
jgi:TfoX/Sxy family transcriptional regulator of competence genes